MADTHHKFIAVVLPSDDKIEQQAAIDRQVEEFLARGGQIRKCAIRTGDPKQQSGYTVMINGIEFPAMNSAQAARRINRSRKALQLITDAEGGPIYQKQMGGKREVLFPIPQFEEWARKAGYL